MLTPAPGDIVTPPDGDDYGYDVTQHGWFDWGYADDGVADFPINYADGKGYVIVKRSRVPANAGVKSGDHIAWSPGYELAYNLDQHKWFPTRYVQAVHTVGATAPWTQA